MNNETVSIVCNPVGTQERRSRERNREASRGEGEGEGEGEVWRQLVNFSHRLIPTWLRWPLGGRASVAQLGESIVINLWHLMLSTRPCVSSPNSLVRAQIIARQEENGGAVVAAIVLLLSTASQRNAWNGSCAVVKTCTC